MGKSASKTPVVLCVLAATGGLTAAGQSGLEVQVADILANQLIGAAHAADDRLAALGGLVKKYDAKRVSIDGGRIVLFDQKGGKHFAPDGTYLFPDGTRVLQQKGKITESRKVATNLGSFDDKADWTEGGNGGWKDWYRGSGKPEGTGGDGTWNRDASGDANATQLNRPSVQQSLKKVDQPSLQKQPSKQLPGDHFEFKR